MAIWSRVLDCLDCPASASQVTRLIVWSFGRRLVAVTHPDHSDVQDFINRSLIVIPFFENFMAQTPFHPFDPWRVAARTVLL